MSAFVYKVALRNVWISILAIVMNTISCVTQAVFFILVTKDVEMQYTLAIVEGLIFYEVSWMGASIKVMSFLWLPKRFRPTLNNQDLTEKYQSKKQQQLARLSELRISHKLNKVQHSAEEE